jgi:sugar phosphate permease
MFVVLALICLGLLGACLFTTGIIFSMMSLTIAGIILLALSIASMALWYVYKKPQNQGMMPIEKQQQTPVAYTTNNMNTMKRNKSDTDLELISSQA